MPVAIKKIPMINAGDLVQFEGSRVPQEFVHQYLASQISQSLFVYAKKIVRFSFIGFLKLWGNTVPLLKKKIAFK